MDLSHIETAGAPRNHCEGGRGTAGIPLAASLHQVFLTKVLIFISGENLVGIEPAATLYRIVISPEGAQAAVDANVLECVAELLSSPNASVRGWPCEMLRQLARHKTTVSPAVRQLVSLLRSVSIMCS
jgi:hypothetical protein